MSKKNFMIKNTALAVTLGCISFSSLAEITLLKQDPKANDPLGRLQFQVGGSIRPQFINEAGHSDQGSYKRNGYDGGTRFRFSADYYLFDDVSLIGYYELGVNTPRVFDWDNHYKDGDKHTDRRMLFGGLKSKTWGTLTYGKQRSIYYSVIGAKTDIWDFDMQGQAPGNGFNGNYDGSYRSYNLLHYKNTFGPVDLYLGGIMRDDSHPAGGNGLRYQRKGGAALGVDYHINQDLTWGTAYSYIKQSIMAPNGIDSGTSNTGQQLLGTGLSWKPGNWTLAAGGGWYRNFLMTTQKDRHDYFAGNAYGGEYYVGYTLPVKQYLVKNITPYYAGDRLKFNTDRDYQQHHNTLGISTMFDYGFQIDVEHVFTNSTDGKSDLNLVRLRYDF
jgi:predicted porin